MRRKALLMTASVAGFVLVCLAAVLLVCVFLTPGDYMLGTPDDGLWQIVDASGAVSPCADTSDPLPDGSCYLYTAHMPDSGAMPGLYDGGYICFVPSGSDYTVLIDGAQVYGGGPSDSLADSFVTEIRIYADPSWAGKELTIKCGSSALGFGGPVAPLFSDSRTDSRFVIAMSNIYAIPTGAFLILSVLVTAIFFVGLFFGSPDWSLICLALVSFFTALWAIVSGIGFFFLPEKYCAPFESRWCVAVDFVLIALYLFLNRRRSFWRRFGRCLLVFAAALAALYAVLRLTDSPVVLNIEQFLQSPLQSIGVLSVLVECLVAICCGIAVLDMVKLRLSAVSQARALSVRQDLLLDAYRGMERSVNDTAVMRHEWKNRVSSLHLLAKQGDIEGLEQSLAQLDGQLGRLSAASFSENFTVNVILQNIAARASDSGVSFTASAHLPEKLGVDDADLCSLLINMLENALAAAASAPQERRHMSVSLRVSQGFLAIKCENGYSGTVPLGRDGTPLDKPLPGHGYGIPQMRQIAKKYGGILDLGWASGIFTLQTALNLR